MQAADGNYDQVIGRHWRDYFARLPADSRILDLATGNGAVLHFALDSAQRHDTGWQMYGVDLASIDPWSHLDRTQLPQLTLRFLPNINIETLPFAARMFDAVVSQYGVEYADWRRSIPEALRVLRRGGNLNWICHCDTSSVYANTVREISDARYLLEQAAVTQHLRQLINVQTDGDQFIPDSHQATLRTPQRQAMVQALQGCFMRLREAPRHSEILDVALQNLAYIYQHREAHTPALVNAKIDEIYAELKFFIERLEALVESAVTAADLDLITALLTANGMLDIQSTQVRKPDGVIVGLQITARKPTD